MKVKVTLTAVKFLVTNGFFFDRPLEHVLLIVQGGGGRERQTERQTDRQTDRQRSIALCLSSKLCTHIPRVTYFRMELFYTCSEDQKLKMGSTARKSRQGHKCVLLNVDNKIFAGKKPTSM